MKTKSLVLGSLLGLLLVLFTSTTAWAAQRELSDDGNGGYYINMPATGVDTLVIPDGVTTFKVYDDGGVSGNFSRDCDGILVLVGPENLLIRLNGTIRTEYDGWATATFSIYDAIDKTNKLYGASRKSDIWWLSEGNNLITGFSNLYSRQPTEGLNLTVTLVDKWGPFTIEEVSVAGGNLIDPPATAATGDVVSVTASNAAEGYLFDHIEIMDERGNLLDVTGGTWLTDKTATFVMPASNAIVEPIYVTESQGVHLEMPYEKISRVSIPADVESFILDGNGDFLEVTKPFVLTAPEGYLIQVEGLRSDVAHSYDAGSAFYVYDGDVPDAYESRAELITRMSSSQTVTIVYVGSGEFTGTMRVKLVDASVTHNVDVHYSGNGYAGGDLSSASTGNTINLTATPDEGYMIGSIYAEAYLEDESWSLPITGGTWYTSNDYSFTMPYADVRVNVEFVEKKTTANEGLSIEMPQRDTVFATIPADVESFAVGGECVLETCNGTLVLAAPEGLKFQLTGDVKTYGNGARMAVFDGSGTGATKIWELDQGNGMYLNSSGDTLTLHYESSDSYMRMNLLVTIIDPNKKYRIEFAKVQGGTIDDYPESAAPGDTVTMNITTDIKSYNVCVEAYDLKTTFYEFNRCYRSAWYENQVQFVMPEKDLSLEVYIFEAEYGDAVIPRADTLRLDIPEGMKSIDIYSDYSNIDWLYYSNSDGVLVLTAPEGYKLVVAEGAGDISDEGDSLIIYAGDGVDAERELATISVGGEIGELENTGRSLTFKFKSDGEGNGEGVYANVRVVDVNEVYSITLAGTWNGNMISDKLSATVGDTVTLVATPDEGYLLNYFTVDWEDFHGSWNSISPVGGTWYSGNEAKFVMPRGDVLIYAEFRSPNDYLRATIPTTDTVVANIPEGIRKLTVRTACGWAYCDNNDGVLVLTAPEGYSLRLSGNTALVDEDSLFIYDGAGTDAKVLAKMSNNNNHIDYIYSTGRSLAFQLKSNENGNDEYPELSVDVLKKSGSSAVAVYEYYNGYKFARIDGLYDGKDTVNIEEDMEVNNVEFIRNFAVTANDLGKYSTIVFPFDFNASSVSGLDDILEFSQMTEENGKLQVEMNRVWCRADVDPDRDCSSYEGNLKANTPYMLKMTNETLFFNGSNYTIKKTEPAVATSGNWQFIGTYAYKKWEKGDTDLGSVYGFAATASNGAEIGQFVKAGSGAFIRPMRAYLKYSAPNGEPRPAPAGHVSVWRDRSNELPEEIEVVVVEGKGRAGIGSGESGSEKTTTVIGRINTRTGEFTPVTRTYDLKGRSLNAKPKAKGVYVGKKR